MEHAVGEVCTLCSGPPDCCWGEWSGEEEVGAEVEGEKYCTERSTAGNGVCVPAPPGIR